MFNLDFESDELQFPCHPRHAEAAERITRELRSQGLKGHFLIFSSGTTSSDLKGYALSREALLANARAVNHHFNLSREDVWGLSIPYFHVGGLSVLARAHELGTQAVDLSPWRPHEWVEKVTQKGVTITTVVPTQVYDLVQLQIPCPPELKYLVVGGDYLGQELEKRALELKWPIIRTFGMTEVCSQLASAKKPLGPLEVLPIHEVKLEGKRLMVKSKALFGLQFKLTENLETRSAREFCDEDGFYGTSDLAEVCGNVITPLGRMDDQLKVAGKLVSFNSLKDALYAYALKEGIYGKVELTIVHDERQGQGLVLLHLEGTLPPPLDLFSPLKFTSREVSSFERTDLGKLKK